MKIVAMLLAGTMALVGCGKQSEEASGSEVKDSPVAYDDICYDPNVPNGYTFVKRHDSYGMLSGFGWSNQILDATVSGRDYVGWVGTAKMHVVYDRWMRTASIYQIVNGFYYAKGLVRCHGGWPNP